MLINSRPRLLLAIPHLGGGGAEHVIALLAQHLDPTLFEIHLAVLTPDAPGAPTLPLHIHLHRLHCRRVRHAALPLLRLIRTLQPRLILSGMAHLSFLILLLKPFLSKQTRILIRQNTTPSAAANTWLTCLAYRWIYPWADRILCQSQAMADDLIQNFYLDPEKLTVLYNPVAPRPVSESASSLAVGPNLLYVGRLSHEKGADLLLHAFAELLSDYPGATLTFLGIGPQEAALKRLTHSLGIGHAVRFAGHINPAPCYASATLFVLPSRHEGIPNALLEAAVAGLPIVATPANNGLVDLLRGAPGCWLTSQITSLALAHTIREALVTLQTKKPRFQHAFVAPFRLEPAIAAYSNLLLGESHPRLAFLIPTISQIGGAERQVLEIAQEFARRRWPVTLIALGGDGGSALPALQAVGVRFLSLRMRKAWIDPAGWLRYLRWHRIHRPEILHAHLPHAIFFARFSRLLAPTPVLIDTIHTTAPGPLTRRLAYRLTNPLTTCVTCVSRAVQDTVRTARIASSATLIPNGIPIPNLPAPNPPGRYFRWIAVGRLSPVKDYPTLLRAFAQLPPHATLTIAGSGPNEEQLRTLSHTLDISSRVCFAGFQTEIQALLANTDAFVQSSLWEGLPIAILEASAAALPVVATDAAGTRETLLHGQSGLLTPIADPVALAATMLQIMEMPPDNRGQMGLCGRTFIQSNFALPEIASRWERLYRQLLHKTFLPSHVELPPAADSAGT